MNETAQSPRRIYLDNGATSWPKPEEVYRAVEQYQREVGAPAGRSVYAEALSISRGVDEARRRVAQFLGLDEPTQLIFCLNGTDALNLAIHGLLRAGDHVVTTVVEHNSVLRPLSFLEQVGLITVDRVGCNARGYVDPDDVRRAMRSSTRLVAVCHASNVTGAVQDVAAIAQIAHGHDALVLCDAAQSAGHMNVDMTALGVDLLAAPGHKGLLGPLGTGVLAMTAQAAAELHSVRQGGTGTQSDATSQPDELPFKFEAGNLNVPGILGLAAGVEFLDRHSIHSIEEHGRSLTAQLLGGFGSIAGATVWGPPADAPRAPLVSITLAGYDPQEAASILDSAYRVQVRAGLHCAPEMHRAQGTEHGGTLRFSLGVFNTRDDVETAVKAVAEIVEAHVAT